MGSKSPIVITDTVHSAKADHKFNAKPRPFGVQSSPVQVKPVSKPAIDPDSFEDSEVLRMLKSSSISTDSGLASSARTSDDFDDLPPPPPEAFTSEDDPLPTGQSRSFKLLQRTVDGGDSHPSVFSLSEGDRARPNQSRPYTVTSSARAGSKAPVQAMNTKEPPPCPPGVKPMQVLPSEINFTRPSDAARAAYAERRQAGSSPTPVAPAQNVAYSSRPAPVSKPKPSPTPSNSQNPQNPHCHGCGQIIQGSFLSALGRNWHPEHFNCAGCRKSLQNKGFVEESDNLYCESCYDMKFAPHCDVCNEAIVGPCVKAIGKMFHPEHFICAHCGKQIANESFHLDSGKPYCAQDYRELFCVKCCSCKQVIGGGDRWLEALEKPWHADCFRCAVCSENLENTGFYSMGAQAVCPKHA